MPTNTIPIAPSRTTKILRYLTSPNKSGSLDILKSMLLDILKITNPRNVIAIWKSININTRRRVLTIASDQPIGSLYMVFIHFILFPPANIIFYKRFPLILCCREDNGNPSDSAWGCRFCQAGQLVGIAQLLPRHWRNRRILIEYRR